MKRVLTIQDFSCVGRCSLTVALPIISAAGVECCGIPTALLSNHTGFSSFFCADQSDKLLPISEQLKLHGITFDAIYTGYIASAEQLGMIEGLIDEFRGKNTLVLIDPVMGDNGRMYPALEKDFPECMARLCEKADIITPNLTEACLLTGRKYSEDIPASEYEKIITELYQRYGAKILLTGVCGKTHDELGAYSFDGEDFGSTFTPKIPLSRAGTGDIFSSALIGALMRGLDFGAARSIAVTFTSESIRLTTLDPEHREYGVNFEQALPIYIEALNHGN